MNYRVYIDTFTSLDDLKPKERRDPEAVLAVLRRVGRFSVWDMDNRALRETVCDLETKGRIVTDQTLGFPWIHVTIPEALAPKSAVAETETPVSPASL